MDVPEFKLVYSQAIKSDNYKLFIYLINFSRRCKLFSLAAWTDEIKKLNSRWV